MSNAIQQTVDNLAALGISKFDAERAIAPLTQAVMDNWLKEVASHVKGLAGANATKAEAERKHAIYQDLVALVYQFHSPEWNTSKRQMAREMHELIIGAGYDGAKHPIETIRKNIEILS